MFKTISHKEKIDTFKYIKIDNFHFSKDTIIEVNKQAKKIFLLVFRVHKKLLYSQ